MRLTVLLCFLLMLIFMACKSRDTDQHPFILKGKEFEKKENYQNALIEFEKFITQFPEEETGYYEAGRMCLNLREEAKAAANFSKAIELNPKHDSAFYYRGVSLMRRENYPRAEIDFSKSIILNPNKAIYYIDRGVVKMEMGNHEGALEDFHKYLKIHPKDEKVYLNLAMAENSLGHYEKGIEYSTKAIELNNNWGMAYYIRGESYLFSGDTAKLCNDLALAMKLNYLQAMQRVSMYCLND